jgi:hypothetical protein
VFSLAFKFGVLKLACSMVARRPTANAYKTVKSPHETNQSMKLTEENTKTNTQRGLPQIKIALLAEGRPLITGVSGGLIFAAKCGENCRMVLVTFSLKVPAKLSFRKAIVRAVNMAATIASGLLRNPIARMNTIMMK